jgi:hypothetical protein
MTAVWILHIEQPGSPCVRKIVPIMPNINYRFSLSQEERDEPEGFVAKGMNNLQ